MVFCDFIAGSIGGMMGVFAGHPFDTVKVNQQLSNTGMIQCSKSIYQRSGVFGFFRGAKFPLIAYGGINSLFFGVYGHSLEYLIKESKCPLEEAYDLNEPSDLPEAPLTVLEAQAEEERIARFNASYRTVFVAGVIAGIAQLGVMNPVEVLKIRQQAELADKGFSKKPKIGIFRYVFRLVRTNGIGILYKGFIPGAMREGPSSGIYMSVYHLGCQYTDRLSKGKDDWIHYAGLFTAGGVAGLVAWWSILPIDVVKSMIQADDPKNPKYKGTMDCSRQIWRDQGIKGFFRGFTTVSLRAFPINGITFLAYEFFIKVCKNQMNAHGTKSN